MAATSELTDVKSLESASSVFQKFTYLPSNETTADKIWQFCEMNGLQKSHWCSPPKYIIISKKSHYSIYRFHIISKEKQKIQYQLLPFINSFCESIDETYGIYMDIKQLQKLLKRTWSRPEQEDL